MPNELRHLCYHIWPYRNGRDSAGNGRDSAGNGGNWKTAISQLIHRIGLFNGVRSICVAVDHTTATLEDVQELFTGYRIDNWFYVDNNPGRRECVSFEALLNTVPHDSGYTLWAHGKSVRHSPGSITVKWSEWQYKLLCDRFDLVDTILDKYPLVGCFYRQTSEPFGPMVRPGKYNQNWHFSGGVYWINNAKVFSIPQWEELPTNFFGGTEAWPGYLFEPQDVGNVGPQPVNDLYHQHEWDRIQPELDKLCQS